MLWLRCSNNELQYNCGGKLSGGDEKKHGKPMRTKNRPHGDRMRKHDGLHDIKAHCLSFLSGKSDGCDTTAIIMMNDRRYFFLSATNE